MHIHTVTTDITKLHLFAITRTQQIIHTITTDVTKVYIYAITKTHRVHITTKTKKDRAARSILLLLPWHALCWLPLPISINTVIQCAAHVHPTFQKLKRRHYKSHSKLYYIISFETQILLEKNVRYLFGANSVFQ